MIEELEELLSEMEEFINYYDNTIIAEELKIFNKKLNKIINKYD
jgi:hypothetical protein